MNITNIDKDTIKETDKDTDKEKILLALLPYWTPLIPPMGIACLKSFLRRHGYDVKTTDSNLETRFKELYTQYFETLSAVIPGDRRGNFYSIGQDVLHNHLMAHFNKTGGDAYTRLVKVLVDKTFFCPIDDDRVETLNGIIGTFYDELEKYLEQLLENSGVTIFGLSVCSGNLPASLYAFRYIRERYPRIRTVMGGGIFCDQFAGGTPNLEILLEKTKGYLDNIIIGEGELLFLKMLKNELPEGKRVYSLRDIDGENLDLSAAPVPDFSDFELEHYPYLSAYTSRSCPYQCKFCSDTVMWGGYRKKSAPQIVKEFNALHQDYGYRLFMMSDLLLNPVVQGLSREMEDNPVRIYWDGCLRAERHVCDIDNTMLWRRGGMYKARIGCESGSPRVLELMEKRVTVEQIKSAIFNLAQAGIQVTSYWVIGFPGETEEDFQMTLDLLEELKDEMYEAECRPFYYYLKGQANSSEWSRTGQSIPLYPGEFEDMLLFQTWMLDAEPSREETYRRVSRFVAHCKKLGIPNPYTLKDIYEADQRWKMLHKNAVPSLVELKSNDDIVDEIRSQGGFVQLRDSLAEEGDFNF